MSGPEKTEAIALRSIKFGDTSKIITFYTREFGKLKAIAKGARQAKNKFGSAFEPMTHVSLIVYRKEHREIQLVSQCDVIRSWHRMSDKVEKLEVGLSILELVDKVSHDEEAKPELFNLLLEVFAALNDAKKNELNLFCVFIIHLAGLLGFRPQFNACTNCGRTIDPDSIHATTICFQSARGGFLCTSCADFEGPRVKFPVDSIKWLELLQNREKLMEAAEIDMPGQLSRDLVHLLLGFLRYHVDGLQHLRTERVFARISL